METSSIRLHLPLSITGSKPRSFLAVKNSLSFVFGVALLGSFIGCANQAKITNLTPLNTYQRKVHTFVDPDANFQKYQTFAIVPYSKMIGKTSLNPIAERQMMFFLRNLIEFHGYKYVSIQDSADFVFTIDADDEYREHYVPPVTVQVPVWVPSQTTTSTTKTQGDINAYSGGDYASGDYNGKSTTVTTTPGHLETGTETRGGYTVGHNYPRVSIFGYDAKSSKNIYQADGTGISDNDDARIACEWLADDCSRAIPRPDTTNFSCPPLKGRVGVNYTIITTDGNTYWPGVIAVVPNSPAEDAGIIPGDLILSIDGKDTRNKDYVFVLCLMRGDPGATHNFVLWRTGNRVPVAITLKPMDEVYKKK
jgi:hypothetical protein